MTWFYDPELSYADNYARGPFGAFAKAGVDTRVQSPTEPSAHAQSFLGIPVRSAFGIPAGPLLNARFCAAAFAHGFDVNVYKTVRSRAHAAHPWPNILGVDGGPVPSQSPPPRLTASADLTDATSITNSFGVPSMEPAIWQSDMAVAAAAVGPGQVLVGSFQGTRGEDRSDDAYVDDHAHTAALVRETGVPVLELNLSCPNEGTGALLCFDAHLAERCVRAVRERIGDSRLVLKLAYFRSDAMLADVVRRTAPLVDAYSAINTLPAHLVTGTGTQALPGAGREVGGVCGAGIGWAAREMVARLARLREARGESWGIVGVGGVMTAADARWLIACGADAVMSATGALRDPGLGAAVAIGASS